MKNTERNKNEGILPELCFFQRNNIDVASAHQSSEYSIRKYADLKSANKSVVLNKSVELVNH